MPILKNLSFDESAEDESPRRDTLSVLLERYIEWKVEFAEGERDFLYAPHKVIAEYAWVNRFG